MLAEKFKLHYCAENVASMTAESKAVFSKLLRVMPIRVCASGISHCRRPRYFWADWAIPESPGVQVTQGPTHVDVRFTADRADPALWTDPGWQ